MSTYQAPPRRRLYLMRHGSVDYFRADGSPVAPDGVPLNSEGEQQADAAGALFAASGVRFDHVLVSGLPRTVQTAQRVLAAAGQALPLEVEPALQEIRGGRLGDIAPSQVAQAFLGAFGGGGPGSEHERFLGGESVAELLDRTLPAFAQWRARTDWQCALVVLHGGVNRALLSQLLAGGRAFFGALEQQPACINVIDIGADHAIVRAINLAPTNWLQPREQRTTMEKLLALYQRGSIAF